jgi:hypothetical protein
LNDFYTAAKKGREPALPVAADAWLAVTRRDYVVRRYELSHTQFVLLRSLSDGRSIGEALEAAAEIYPGTIESLIVDIREWFQTWAAAPMFTAITLD